MHCHRAYIGAVHVPGGKQIRRLLNQSIFTEIYIDDGDIQGDLADPFRTLLGEELANAAKQHAANKGSALAVGSKPLASSGNDPRTSLTEMLEKRNKNPTTVSRV
ncbi:hypothetical protein BKG78_16165 [Mycobacteroides chelonae]|nr:hypothetical protein BKG78_16165 [Mycobacteroides chelonae]